MKSNSFFFTFFILFVIAQSVFPQWAKKTPAEWTQKDAEKVLTDSPWTKEAVWSEASSLFSRNPERQPGQVSGTGRVPDALHVKVRVSFFSAKPVRVALARIMKIRSKGKMAEQMTQQMQTFTEGEFHDYIVLTLNVDTSQPGANVQEMLGLLTRLGTATLKNSTYLEVKGGKKAYLDEFKPPSGDGFGAKMIFARLVNGEPLIGPETGDVHFVSELSDRYTINLRFKVKDMYFEDKLEY